MSLYWENLSFHGNESIGLKIRNSICGCCCPGQNRQILEGLSGGISIGHLTAFLGPSGAGKSTLLKCLTSGKNYNGCDGKIFVDSDQDIRASFITQDEKDHLLMNLTVVESLRFACILKNSKESNLNVRMIVRDLLSKLDLTDVKHNLVENCSGGQKKRLAIGLELTSVKKPNYLFLDEPTSGLDSFAGFQVIELLRRLATEENMAIVTTIHQPSYQMLLLFQKIYVLTKAGKCIYSGPPDQLANEINNERYDRISQYDNPGDVIIEIAAKDDAKKRKGQFYIPGAISNVESAYLIDQDIRICISMKELNAQRNSTPDGNGTLKEIEGGICKNNASFGIANLGCLFIRTCVSSIWRQKRFILIRLGLHGMVALVLAGLYSRGIGSENGCLIDPLQIQSNCSNNQVHEGRIPEETITSKNVKFQFFSLLFLMFASLMPTVLTFPVEIKIFLNEHRNGWYTTFSYYFSKTIAEIPLQFLFPFFYTYFLYWYSGQLGLEEWYEGFFGFMTWRYFYFLSITILSCFIAQGLGFLIGILCVNSFNITIIVSSSVLLFLFLFSGFFVKTNQMGPSVEWITYLSFIRFSFESLIIVLYGFGRCDMVPELKNNTILIIRDPPQSAVLLNFDLKDEDLIPNLIWLIIHLIGLRVIAFIVLQIRANPNFFSIFGFLWCKSKSKSSKIDNTLPSTEETKCKNPFMSKVFSFMGSCTFLVIKFLIIILLVQMVIGGVILLSRK